MKKDYVFTASDGENIYVTTYGNNDVISKKCLILVHGFKGFKDWGFGPYIGDYFSGKGFFVITFNFSHNGIGNNPLEFTELDKFAKNTFSREVSELSEIIDAYKNNYFGNVENNKIGLIGHSRGGAISLLTAVQKKEISAVALWASVSKLDRYSLRQKEEWRKKGSFDVMNMRTKQIMRLNVSLLEDIENNSQSLLNIEQAAKKINKPLLIAHGEQDLAVPLKEAQELYNWADKRKTELFAIKSTGHTFDIVHPFEGSNEKFEKLLEKTHSFFVNSF